MILRDFSIEFGQCNIFLITYKVIFLKVNCLSFNFKGKHVKGRSWRGVAETASSPHLPSYLFSDGEQNKEVKQKQRRRERERDREGEKSMDEEVELDQDLDALNKFMTSEMDRR